MGSISHPDLLYVDRNNNIGVETINEMMRSQLTGLDVEEFDTFGITFPRCNHVVHTIHYGRDFYNDNETIVYFHGDVGKEVTHNLVSHICNTK